MSRDSGDERPSQRTVAELLAEYGGNSTQQISRRRRRRADDVSETAPQAIIDRVMSDSGRLRPIPAEADQWGQEQPASEQPAPQAPLAPDASTAAPQQPRPDAASSPQPARPAQPPSAVAPQIHPDQSAQPAQPTSDPSEGAPHTAANVWAQRFAASSKAGEAHAGGDPEATMRQPTVPAAPPPNPPEPQAGVPPNAVDPTGPAAGTVPEAPPAQAEPAKPRLSLSGQVEPVTEQLPPVDVPQRHDAESFDYGYDDYNGSYDASYDQTAYDEEPYDDGPYDGRAYDDRTYGGAYEARVFEEDDDVVEDGVPADVDYLGSPAVDPDDRAPEEQVEHGSPGKEWFALVGLAGVGLVGGGAAWVGFRWLWNVIPVGALVAALAVTGGLVLIARKLLRSDDLQTVLFAVLVGLTCTVSPAALLLIEH